MPICLKCDTDKQIADFHKDKQKATGHHPWCKSCRLEIEEARRRANGVTKRPPARDERERKREDRARYYAADPERFRKRSREWGRNNTEYVRERSRKWRAENPDKVKRIIARQTAKRQKRLKDATPHWVDMDAIQAIYEGRPEGMQVDHIVPINGRTIEGYEICGLHVHWNLQYLPREENLRKNRNMRPDDLPLACLKFET